MNDLISRQAAVEALEIPKVIDLYDHYWNGRNDQYKKDVDVINNLPSAQGEVAKDINVPTSDCISRQAAINAMCELMHHWFGGDPKDEIREIKRELDKLPAAQPEIIHCCDCIYYDQEHIEKNGVRYEYEDMPKDAFDILGTGLVNSEYGINVGGRCCRDYHVGYSEDKRVFVSKQNYCGRAERRQDE